jgi:hypothetical protein
MASNSCAGIDILPVDFVSEHGNEPSCSVKGGEFLD